MTRSFECPWAAQGNRRTCTPDREPLQHAVHTHQHTRTPVRIERLARQHALAWKRRAERRVGSRRVGSCAAAPRQTGPPGRGLSRAPARAHAGRRRPTRRGHWEASVALQAYDLHSSTDINRLVVSLGSVAHGTYAAHRKRLRVPTRDGPSRTQRCARGITITRRTARQPAAARAAACRAAVGTGTQWARTSRKVVRVG